MEEEPETFLDAIENDRYMEEHHLHVYLEDAIAQLLSLRQESGNKIKPIKFFREYFCSIQQGSHILFREFSFISATPYNRLCVLKAVMRIYKSLLFRVEKLSAQDYHALLELVWPDFPFKVIRETFESMENGTLEDQVTFLEFIQAFRKNFCLDSFTYEEQKLYQQLLHHEEEYAKIDIDDPSNFEGSDKFMSYLSEADLLESTQENECESDASSWSLPGSFRPTTELHKLCLKESNSFSNDETFDAVGKLSHSFSSSKDSSKSDQAVMVLRTASVRGRLKQLSNSLNLLQPESREKHDPEAQHPMCRLRSKSAVAIQRNSPVLHKS